MRSQFRDDIYPPCDRSLDVLHFFINSRAAFVTMFSVSDRVDIGAANRGGPQSFPPFLPAWNSSSGSISTSGIGSNFDSSNGGISGSGAPSS